ncbi:hypothetical protein MKEN_01368300 [Mycena kentingensis (nom. inval.)]|nr:hypothetical protein MKEN_01368300 [Mycena kentingensis (nom. inval.)]
MSSNPFTFTLPSPPPQHMDLIEMLRSGDDSRQRRHRPERTIPKVPQVALFCGADLPASDEPEWDQHRSWTVQIVPEDEPEAVVPPRKRLRRTNGCGTRIHTHADPDKTWTGLPDGVNRELVIPLAEKYFSADAKRELMLGSERCGCTRTGRGCAVCGNVLGAYFKPCERHVSFLSHFSSLSKPHYVFLRNAVSPPLPEPPRRTSDDSSHRRPRDREEFQRLRARIRERNQTLAAQAQARAAQSAADAEEAASATTAPPIVTDDAPPRVTLSRLFTWRDRLSPPLPTGSSSPSPVSSSQPIIPIAPAPSVSAPTGLRAFAAWADDTMERATAVAATDIPLLDFIDIPPLPDPPAFAPRPETPEWWRNLRNGVRPLGSGGLSSDWPPPARSYERSTRTTEVDAANQDADKEESLLQQNLFER